MAIRFAIDGDLRFISHHDTMRLFERALARARVPVRYSEGFNPGQKLSLPLPRAVGVASEADLLVVELTEPKPPAEVAEALGPQMPAGLRLLDAWSVDVAVQRGRLQPVEVTYLLPLPEDLLPQVREAARRLMLADALPVNRGAAGGKPGRTVDLRAFLLAVDVAEATLRWTVRVTNAGTARPAEVLAAVGLEPEEYHHRVRRIEVRWSTGPAGDDGEPVTCGTESCEA